MVLLIKLKGLSTSHSSSQWQILKPLSFTNNTIHVIQVLTGIRSKVGNLSNPYNVGNVGNVGLSR